MVSDWTRLKLGEIFRLTSGKSKPKKLLNPFSKEYTVPVYGGNGINGYTDDLLISNVVIVIGRVGEYCGVVHKTNGPTWVTDNALYTKEFFIDTDIDFTFYLLDFHNLSKLRSKSGQPLVSQKPINDYEVDLPPLPEQHKIANILTSVDHAIEKTESIIEQTETVKKGLMQQLLTKGIGHTKFKQTEIGEIPEEWEVENNFITIKSGYGFKLSQYTDTGVPLIRINNIKYGRLDMEDVKYLPKEYLKLYSDFVLHDGDIIMALNRPITQNKLKISQIDKLNTPAILYQRIGKLIMDEKKYNHRYIYHYLQSDKFINQLKQTFVGSDQPFIKSGEFAKLLFAIPKLEEQNEIVDIIESITNKQITEQQKLTKLQTLKKGLMQVLLTGKVRVKVDETEEVTS